MSCLFFYHKFQASHSSTTTTILLPPSNAFLTCFMSNFLSSLAASENFPVELDLKLPRPDISCVKLGSWCSLLKSLTLKSQSLKSKRKRTIPTSKLLKDSVKTLSARA